MVRRDLRSRGVSDVAVLAAMAAVPREAFVDPAFLDAAYEDRPLPIGHGQTISQPLVVALMAQAAAVAPTEVVLEVGTGCGYAAAVLGRLAAAVHSVERIPALARRARATLAALGATNVVVHEGDGSQGWPPAAPFAAIIVAAGAERLPGALVEQLALGGRLILPLGPHPPNQQLLRLRRLAPGRWQREELGPVRFVPLVAAAPDGEDR